ncbi:hypothetical protein ACIQU6_30600 [Streptomyces sp. NPDC090442]|uniref:hypothetical protein n=1 Tax=Streptomyces sp. NPDC090442 TaxID=3365962 RepID=UPI0037FB6560
MSTWETLAPRQRTAARAMLDHLHRAGVTDADRDTVAANYDAVARWQAGTLLLGQLCRQAGWTVPPGAPSPEPGRQLADAIIAALKAAPLPERGSLPHVAHVAEEVAALAAALTGRRRALADAITAADANNQQREDIVRAAAPGAGRRTVFNHLGAHDVLATVVDVVHEYTGGDSEPYDVTLTTVGGAVRMEFEANYADDWNTHGYGDFDDEPDEYEQDRRNAGRRIGELNFVNGLLNSLTRAGVAYETDGHHESAEALRAGKPATLTLTKTQATPTTDTTAEAAQR